MNFQNIVAVNASLNAQAEQLDQLAKFHDAEAEKARGVAKNLRALADPAGAQNDPKVEVLKPLDLSRVLAVGNPGHGNIAAPARRPSVNDAERIRGHVDGDDSFHRPSVGAN